MQDSLLAPLPSPSANSQWQKSLAASAALSQHTLYLSLVSSQPFLDTHLNPVPFTAKDGGSPSASSEVHVLFQTENQKYEGKRT